MKVVHNDDDATGAVVRVKFEKTGDSPYTGDFQGNPSAMMHISLATTRVAIKFLHEDESRMPSASCRDPNSPRGGLGTKRNAATCTTPARVGTSRVASRNNDGSSVDKETVKFPYQVQLVPNPNLKAQMYKKMDDLIHNLPPGTRLYTLQGKANPESKWANIGSFTTTSLFSLE